MSSVPTSFYGIHPNDDQDPHQNFMAPIDANSNMGSGELFCPTPFNGVPAPSFPNPNNISATYSPQEEPPAFRMNGITNNASLAPAFPTCNAFPRFQIPFAMASSLFSPGLPTSPKGTLAPSPCPSRGNVPKRKRNHKLKSKDIYKRIGADLIKSAHTRRTRGPTRNISGKPYCARFEDMFNKLPLEVQRALNLCYTGCCETMTDRDNSTRQKHMFSKRHYDNLPREYLNMLPCFVCPAYIAFHGACTGAKPGRYDSAERHCKNCVGFQAMNFKSRMFPLEISKGEYEAIKIHRAQDARVEDLERTRPLVASSVNKLLGVMAGHENIQIHETESNFLEAIRAIFKSLGKM